MTRAPALIDTLALYIRSAEPSLSPALALAEAAQQTRFVSIMGHVRGGPELLADATRRRADLAAAAWRDLQYGAGDLATPLVLQEALDVSWKDLAPPARPWLVEFVLQERDFTMDRRRALADKGHAMPDGSYPIETVADLRNAIRAIGRAGAGKMAAVKRFILKRARALKATSLLPEGWAAVQAAEVAFMGRPIVLQEVFLPGRGGGGEVAFGGDMMEPEGDGDGDEMPGDVHLAPGTGTVGGPSGKVRSVQRAMTEMGHYHGAIDGMYGPVTMTAVQDVQRAGGLRAHGHVDGATLQALDRNSSENVFVTVAGKRS